MIHYRGRGRGNELRRIGEARKLRKEIRKVLDDKTNYSAQERREKGWEIIAKLGKLERVIGHYDLGYFQLVDDFERSRYRFNECEFDTGPLPEKSFSGSGEN